MDAVQERLQAKGGDLADQVDTYEIDGFNFGWDYLDSTGNRTMALAEIITATCVGAYETGTEDGAVRRLEEEMMHTVRNQNDVLVLVFVSAWALDNVCYDYAS